MNTQSNAMHESALESQTIAPAVMSPTRPVYWALRRELWENRFVYVAPLAVASVFLVGYLISMIHLPTQMRELSGVDPAHYREAILRPYDIAAAFMMITYILVTLFYCAEALHGERRDRSILFWKSLPVSDLTTVLAKASIPFIVLPLLTFAIILVLQFILLLLSSAVLLATAVDALARAADVTSAALPYFDRACALAGTGVLLAAAGIRLGTPCGISMGVDTGPGDCRRRKDCVPHCAFRYPGGVPIDRELVRDQFHARYLPHGSNDAYHPR